MPTKYGAEGFAELARRGVKVRVLTNSLAATDVAAIHAGYANRRQTLLEAGVQLFELQRTSGTDAADQRLQLTACEVRLAPRGGLEWVDRSKGVASVLTTEPESGPLKRTLVRIMFGLPIEWLLWPAPESHTSWLGRAVAEAAAGRTRGGRALRRRLPR